MKAARTRRSLAAILLLGTLLLPSCIGMARQRIVTYSDPGRDRFELLLFSEGVYRSDSNRIDDKEAKRFVEGSGFVLGSWPFQVFKDPLLEEARKPKRPEYGKFIKRLANSFRTIHLGHYRDHDNHISVAQRVIITNVSELVHELHKVAPAFLRHEVATDKSFLAKLPQTRQAILAAGDSEFEWLVVDGHSLLFQVPVDPGEWPALRDQMLAELKSTRIPFVVKTAKGILPAGEKPTALMVEELFAAKPPRIRFRLGSPRGASVARYHSNEDYKNNLEKTIEKLIPRKWDRELANALLEHGVGRRTRKEAEDHELWPILARIPIEDRVRALLRSVERDDVSKKTVAKLLAELAELWNSGGSEPEAPVHRPDAELTDVAVRRWWRWYSRVCEPTTG